MQTFVHIMRQIEPQSNSFSSYIANSFAPSSSIPICGEKDPFLVMFFLFFL